MNQQHIPRSRQPIRLGWSDLPPVLRIVIGVFVGSSAVLMLIGVLP